MAKDKARTRVVQTSKVAVTPKQSASARIAAEGITDSRDFNKLMSSLMGDVLNGNVTTDVANATVNAGGKLLKCIEMRFKYGNASHPAPKQLAMS